LGRPGQFGRTLGIREVSELGLVLVGSALDRQGLQIPIRTGLERAARGRRDGIWSRWAVALGELAKALHQSFRDPSSRCLMSNWFGRTQIACLCLKVSQHEEPMKGSYSKSLGASLAERVGFEPTCRFFPDHPNSATATEAPGAGRHCTAKGIPACHAVV
jgi:hypothetical protein